MARLDPDRILYVPLDIGKNVHWMRADSGAGRLVHPPKELLANRIGYAYWQQCLSSWLTGGQFDLLVIGNEPTGIYHENWCRHILSDFDPYLAQDAQPQLRYRFINPYQSKLERQKLTLRPRNTDPIALQAIASLLRQGQGNPATLPDPDTALLHQYVFFAYQATRKLRAIHIDIQRHLDRLWPGAVINVKRFQQAHPNLPVPTPLVQTKPLEREEKIGRAHV